MEAATLSSPQRTSHHPVAPVQKSLSLPSYAKAGGEGIDHRLIFAALEQREKVRRKSKIFAREKSARQNIFCLPLPSSGNRCRETSFSSDTSCSSLEYQKPKARKEASNRSEPPKNRPPDEPSPEPAASYSNYCNVGGLGERSAPTNSPRPSANESGSSIYRTVVIEQRSPAATMSKGQLDSRKGHNVSPSSPRPYGHSSDSMDRSSRSSSDSLTRKERLVAIKAKVEAEREKFGQDSSSEDEKRRGISRFSSDGVIHRTVREVKSRSYRLEKRLRRRSQDEYGLRKAIRKGRNLSLCLGNGDEDGVYLNLFSGEVKTDFCPSPSGFPEAARRNCFSDFPGKEHGASKNVLTRVRQIEEEEEKRWRHQASEKGRVASSRQSPQSHPPDSSSPFSTQRRNADGLAAIERVPSCGDAMTKCASPASVVRAPTPPPRSPKSMSFLNRAFVLQQSSLHLGYDSRSLERMKASPSVATSRPSVDVSNASTAVSTQALDDLVDRRQLMKARRRTCSFVDCGSSSFGFKELFLGSGSLKCDDGSFNGFKESNFKESSRCDSAADPCRPNSPRSPRVRGCISSSTPSSPLSEDPRKWLWHKSRWEEAERRQEYAFNSLESRRKSQPKPSLFKPIESPTKNTCLCYVLSGNESRCNCGSKSKNVSNGPTASYEFRCSSNGSNLNDLGAHDSPMRLYKSDVNIAPVSSSKSNPEPIATNPATVSPDKTDNLIASANLDSAMKELESIYYSLKITSEALSETNGQLNDLNSETPKNTATNSCEFNPLIPHVPQKSNVSMPEKKVYNIEPYPLNTSNESHAFSSYSYKDNICAKTSESERIAIDELFNDLTRQLDIEQKQFKDSHPSSLCSKWDSKNLIPQKSSLSIDKKYLNDSHISLRNGRREQKRMTPVEFNNSIEQQNCNDACESPLDENQEKKRMTPLESIISIRKELCDLQKGNDHEPSESYSAASKDSQSSSFHEDRKLHAVRSLSESISFLMGNADSSPPVLRKSASDQHRFQDTKSSTRTDFLHQDLTKPSYQHRFPSRDQDSAKSFEPVVAMDPPPVRTMNQPVVPQRSFISERLSSAAGDEIRQIRVSMDASDAMKPAVVRQGSSGLPEYPRLSTAVARQQMTPVRSEARSTPAPKNSGEVLDEKGLERLLSTLLCDVPDHTQSSSRLLTGNGLPSTPPPTTDKTENLKCKRSVLPVKSMDTFLAAAASNSQAAVSKQRLRNEEQVPIKNDLLQNNAQSSHVSFIPVYSYRAVCHSSPRSTEIHLENAPGRNLLTTYSPPSRPRFGPGNNDFGSRFVSPHMRRRSVGFEDMTSFCYSHNMSNEKRFQNVFQNSNIPFSSSESTSNFNSGTAQPFSEEQRENSFSSVNQNSQQPMLGENANDQLQQRPFQQRFKDKSSKRKSSLNRIDFIEFSVPGNSLSPSDPPLPKNSSSDEINESKILLKKPESPVGTSKRKYNVSPNHAASKPEVSASGSSSAKLKASFLPKSSKASHSGSRVCRWRQPASTKLSNKHSHSAGELESLTDLSEVPSKNRSYLSAQECDDSECYHASPKLNPRTTAPANCSSNSSSHNIRCSGKSPSVNHPPHIASQDDARPCPAGEFVGGALSDACQRVSNQLSLSSVEQRGIDEGLRVDSIESPLACSSADVDVNCSAAKFENLQISNESLRGEVYLSAEESGDATSSDGERRQASILRKKVFKAKKELHSILKQPLEEKSSSRAPPSILKHRESSEEKESWTTCDLHSILKKSTSEDESCNSGPDIRPILKLSTDEDSPGGGSLRPRPILKKRTSFSDECSHISYSSSSELKPILKKKSPPSTEDQPKPILKSRRKSEDTRSTVLEVVASRPRAYSTDMGVKVSLEDQAEGLEARGNFSNLKSSTNL